MNTEGWPTPERVSPSKEYSMALDAVSTARPLPSNRSLMSIRLPPRASAPWGNAPL